MAGQTEKHLGSRYIRETDGRTIGLSGNAYVPMKDWNTTEPFGAVRVRDPRHCEHGETVCLECVVEWSWDHLIAFPRTAAGRRLREQIEVDPVLKQRVHFFDREYDPND